MYIVSTQAHYIRPVCNARTYKSIQVRVRERERDIARALQSGTGCPPTGRYVYTQLLRLLSSRTDFIKRVFFFYFLSSKKVN